MRYLQIMMVCLSLVVIGCTRTSAPIVDGWQQRQEASIYRVQPDDTLYSIAWAFGVDYQDLARYNHLTQPYVVHPGQALRMSGSSAASSHESAVTTYADSSSPYSTVNSTPATTSNTSTQTPQKADSSVAAAIPKSNHKPPSVNKVANGTWLWPTQGKLAKPYSPTSGGNHGIDISGKFGQPIIASASGKVVYTGSSMPGYGKLIIIKHNNNDLSAYAFNDSMIVKEGDSVKQGQNIATMGKNSAGDAMLHFEVRKNGKPQNPLDYLKRG